MAISTPTALFKLGDIVYFKPTSKLLMIVIDVKEDKIQCMYLNATTGKFENHFFPIFTLKKYSSAPMATTLPR